MVEGYGEPRAVVVVVAAGREFTLRVIDATRCDLVLIDEILRLCLDGARRGWSIRLTQVDEDLQTLVELIGLTEYLGL
jgi:hypothetical protein